MRNVSREKHYWTRKFVAIAILYGVAVVACKAGGSDAGTAAVAPILAVAVFAVLMAIVSVLFWAVLEILEFFK